MSSPAWTFCRPGAAWGSYAGIGSALVRSGRRPMPSCSARARDGPSRHGGRREQRRGLDVPACGLSLARRPRRRRLEPDQRPSSSSSPRWHHPQNRVGMRRRGARCRSCRLDLVESSPGAGLPGQRAFGLATGSLARPVVRACPSRGSISWGHGRAACHCQGRRAVREPPQLRGATAEKRLPVCSREATAAFRRTSRRIPCAAAPCGRGVP